MPNSGAVVVPMNWQPAAEKPRRESVPVLFEFGFWLSIVIGILFLGLYSRRIATEIRSIHFGRKG